MSAAAGQSRRASLLGSSAEIRLSIHGFLFEHSSIHFHFQRYQPQPARVRTQDYHSAITRVSHQLRYESFPVLYRDTLIHICDTADTYPSSCSATYCIPHQHLRYAKRIGTDELTKLNHELPVRCPNLEHLTLTCCYRPLLPDNGIGTFATEAARDEVLACAFSDVIRDGRFENGIGGLQNATWSKPVTVLCEVYFDNGQEIEEGTAFYARINLRTNEVLETKTVSGNSWSHDCELCLRDLIEDGSDILEGASGH